MTSPAVNPVVRVLASRLRRNRLDELSEVVLRLIVAGIPEYLRPGGPTTEDLRQACGSNVDRMLAELSGEPHPAVRVGSDPLTATGRRRAQQRVPLESVLHSFRIGGRVIWEGLISEASREPDPDALRSLAGEAVAVWDVLDTVSELVAVAYREEQAWLYRRTERHQETVLDALLDGEVTDGRAAREAADVFGIAISGSCVVVATTNHTSSSAPGSPRTALADAGLTSVWTRTGARESGLVALSGSSTTADVLQVLSHGTVDAAAVSPVLSGHVDAAPAHRLALLALDSLPLGFRGVVHATGRLAQALLAADHAVGKLAARELLGGLLALPDSPRRAYLDTIEAMAGSGGSSVQAARLLHCHRNTLLKRASRIEAATGLSPTRFDDLLALHLAVLAMRLEPSRRPTNPIAAGLTPWPGPERRK